VQSCIFSFEINIRSGQISQPHGLGTWDLEAGTCQSAVDSGKSNLVDMFAYVGTADFVTYYWVPAALEFREIKCGGELAIHQYIRDVAQEGADRLAKGLGTEVIGDASSR
jgi:hypothetical protein